jgi:hypothetical protein
VRRIVSVVVLIALTGFVRPSPAQAREATARWTFGADDETDTVAIDGQAPGDEGHPHRATSGGWRLIRVETHYVCAIDPNTGDIAPTYVWLGPNGEYIESCHRTAPPRPIPRALAEETATDAHLPLAQVGMSPPEGRDQMVNVPTWLWVDNWAPVTTSATLRGVTVTVTATPQSVTWDMGAGDPPVVCGAGRRYDPARPDNEQQTDCSYTYRRSSFGQPDERFGGTATMRWAVTWTSSAGESGVLPEVSTTRPFAVRVTEGQAVVTDAR